jgi:hypothetical protein
VARHHDRRRGPRAARAARARGPRLRDTRAAARPQAAAAARPGRRARHRRSPRPGPEGPGRFANALRVADRSPRLGPGRGRDRDPDPGVQPPRDHERPPRRLAGGGRARRGAEAARAARASEGGAGGGRDHAGARGDARARLVEGGRVLREVRDHREAAPKWSSQVRSPSPRFAR